MEEAQSLTTGLVYWADDFAALPVSRREALRDSLVCTGCGADAYFVREARNGRRACFGARPHNEDCELASLTTDGGGTAALDEVDEWINAGDIFRIDPDRARAIRHIDDDPNSANRHQGTAARHTGRGPGGRRTSAIGLARLLRQLVLRENFRRSRTLLIMSDDTRQSVSSGCVHLSEIEEKHKNRLRVYWGTIRFPHVKDDGGAWLNTGRFTPTVVVEEEGLQTLLARAGLERLEDLEGSYFAFMGRLRRNPAGREFLFINDDIDWIAVRPFGVDADIN